jgi:hypothetical protein
MAQPTDSTDDLDPWTSATAGATGAPTGVETVESYETDDGVVFFDAENPLAWVEAAGALALHDLA